MRWASSAPVRRQRFPSSTGMAAPHFDRPTIILMNVFHRFVPHVFDERPENRALTRGRGYGTALANAMRT